jgi:hypothetical protein
MTPKTRWLATQIARRAVLSPKRLLGAPQLVQHCQQQIRHRGDFRLPEMAIDQQRAAGAVDRRGSKRLAGLGGSVDRVASHPSIVTVNLAIREASGHMDLTRLDGTARAAHSLK